MKIARVVLVAARVYLHGRIHRHAIDLTVPTLAHCKACGRFWWAA